MPRLELKQNDTPTLSDQLRNPQTNSPYDLSGATVKLFMVDASTGDLIVNQQATITDAANGNVEYQFDASETARDAPHRAEWRIAFGSGIVRRSPADGYLSIEINEALGTAQAGEVDDQDLTVQTLTVSGAATVDELILEDTS